MIEFATEEKECPYLPDRKSQTEYNFVYDCSAKECEDYIKGGWRRFGKLFFRPICHDCNECKNIKIIVDDFKLSKSFKRVLKKNKSTEVVLKRPSATIECVNLYNKYHKVMRSKRNWDDEEISFKDYYSTFVEGYNEFGFEINFVKDAKLIGVAFFDLIQSGISSTYCFYDHDYEKLSIGTFSILKQIEIAKKLNLKYIYLGYYVKENKSLKYKSRFKPFEIF